MSKPFEKTIALTGATGFVGKHILDEALKAGFKVKALTRREIEKRQGVQWVSGDLQNIKALEKLVEGADTLIHTAGLVKAKRRKDFFVINAGSIKTFLQIIGKPDKEFQFIYISSLAAREPQLSPYAKSKRQAEEILRDASCPWTIVRPPAVYGPGDNEILKLFRAMKRGIAPITGKVENTFSLIHGRDLACAILAATGHAKAVGAVIEPDDKKKGGYTIHDVAVVATSVFGNDVKPMKIPTGVLHTAAFFNELAAKMVQRAPIFSRDKVREMAYPNWVCDIKTHARIAHWKPAYNLEKGIQETIEWYETHKLL